MTDSFAAVFTGDHDRSNFGEVFPHNVQSTGGDYVAGGIFDDQEFLNLFEQGNEVVVKQHLAFTWLAKSLNGAHVGGSGSANAKAVAVRSGHC